MTAVAGGSSTSVGKALGESLASGAEPAKLGQHLLVLVNVGFVVAHGNKFVQQLCHSLRQGLAPRESRVVLMCATQVAVPVKLTFRQTMQQFQTRLSELPFHAMAYSSAIPLWNVPQGMRPSLLEAGTEDEAGLMTNEKADFDAFGQTTSPDVFLLTEAHPSVAPMMGLSARYFGTGGRAWKGILWPGNQEGTLCSLQNIPQKVQDTLQSPEQLMTI